MLRFPRAALAAPGVRPHSARPRRSILLRRSAVRSPAGRGHTFAGARPVLSLYARHRRLRRPRALLVDGSTRPSPVDAALVERPLRPGARALRAVCAPLPSSRGRVVRCDAGARLAHSQALPLRASGRARDDRLRGEPCPRDGHQLALGAAHRHRRDARALRVLGSRPGSRRFPSRASRLRRPHRRELARIVGYVMLRASGA